MRLQFELQAVAAGSRARAARFETLHNEVLTPTFMPVGTHAAVRSQRREDLLACGAQVLLANTYHLILRPGTAVLSKFGGIHGFMNWPRSVLTDSGGFQIFSLPGSRVLSEDYAEFRSYTDGSLIRLSPERSIDAQKLIGADIMMVLDQCVPATVEHDAARTAMQVTHRWAQRSLAARGGSPQALFGIVQGARYADLRRLSARLVTEMPFEGFAIGGLAVGETRAQREECTEVVTELLPHDRPRYLMGVGTTRDLLEAVHRGVDMFDCILPTALAKQGVAFTSLGRRDLRRAAYQGREGAIDPDCVCHTCTTHSIAYLFHLFRAREPSAWQLLGLHNLHFYLQLMRRMRQHILAGTWLDFYHAQRGVLDARDSYGGAPTRRSKAAAREQRLHRGRYRVIMRAAGGAIQDTHSGEVMHAGNESGEEARQLYIEQSRLCERMGRADAPEPRAPLIVWDVGLGAGANAMAAINAAGNLAAASVRRPLCLVSFENDLDSLLLALDHPRWFAHLHHAAPRALLADSYWRNADGSIEWQLLPGDFAMVKFQAPAPDIIFYDPFSFKADAALWTLEAFRDLYDACTSKAVELFTYSSSTSVRSGLLASGFHVAKGRDSGTRVETTIALNAQAAAGRHGRQLLDENWLARWRRSDAQTPLGEVGGDSSWRAAVLNHPQFSAALRPHSGPATRRP